MSLEVTEDISAAALSRYDLLIDARSPAEFAEDHLPGAVNLPVLSDAERAEVGTIYVQDDRFKARRLGGAYVARNVARHLETALADRGGGFRPLVYCWRGGRNPARSCSRASCWRRWTGSIRAGRWWRRPSPARSATG